MGANSRLGAYSNKYGKGSKHGSSYQGSNYIEMIWGKQKLLRVSGRFELSRVQVTDGKIRVICMTQIQRKSILVRVIRGRFELARVRVIGSQLYSPISKFYVMFVGWSVTAVGGIPFRKQSLPCLKIGENFWPVTESVRLTHQFSDTFTNTL